MTTKRSDSAVQSDAEAVIRAKIEEALGETLKPGPVTFDSGATVNVDGINDAQTVFVEIFARQGALKGGQQKKVCQDALKLITLARTRPGSRLILGFADEEAARYASKGTWVSEALASWNVEVLVVDVDTAVRDGIRAAQVRQEMVNPSATALAQPDQED